MSDELKSVIIQIITSWQVIAVTVALVLYLLLVLYVAQYSRPIGGDIGAIKAKIKKVKPKKEKKPPAASAEDNEEPAD